MKLIYSYLQKFLPDLNVEPQKLRDDLTMIGHFTNFYEKIDNEIVFDLDIKINRGDCLGYYGLANDLSVLYNIPLVLPQNFSYPASNCSLPIQVTTDNVTRIMAVKIVHLKNSTSPQWLQTFLKLHGVNSINTLVDLTNYVMFMYSIPNHAFDTAKSNDNLIWEMNSKYSEFTSLDGTVLKLDPSILMINNPQRPLSLSFWGGEDCAIDNQTTSTIIEMAIYKPTTVRQNSRGLKSVTEASIRLEKQLDPDLIPTALDHLVKLINENCGGQITSQVFDYYPNPITPPTIEFNLDLPSIMSGINIPQDVSLDILKRLGCTIRGKFITPPSLRLDITQEEDLVEEVVRFYGYNKIPINEPLTLKQLPDITPKEIYQIEELKDKLVALGYDEILSWPIISKPSNPKTVVTTQNSINSESIYLRQSMTQSLRGQLDQYTRYNLPRPQFFEIGEVFSKEGDKITEQTSLALYNQDSDQLHTDTLRCLSSENWLFQDNFAEIILDNLPKPESYIPQTINNEAIELTSQIITLDANITLPQKRDHQELIREYRSKISENILWSMDIVDIFNNKYTFRVSYYNCTDKLAKSTHLSAFGLLDQTKTTTIAIDPNTETKLLYYDDMYQTTAKAQIIDIRKVNNQNYLILDQTVFFPEGGGQPGDQGTISNSSNNLKIKVILYKDGQILHATSNNTLSIGDQIDLKIDWNRRYKYMKIHSAGHLLHEILMEVDSTLVPLKGYHHDESYLIYSGYIDPKSISQIESKLSTAITADLPIICDYTDLETLKKDARSVPQNLPLHKKLRRLKIGNFPSMADGGVQVKSTEEIGQVKITAIENTQNQCKISYQVL